MTVPAEHVKWLRKSVKEELTCDVQDFPDSDEVSREQAAEVRETVGRYMPLLDQLGWSDDEAAVKEITLDAEFGKALLKAGIKSLGEDMLVAIGHYKQPEELDLAEVRSVGSRAAWLANAFEALDTEEVTV